MILRLGFEHAGDLDHPDDGRDQSYQHRSDAGRLPELRQSTTNCKTDNGTDIAGAYHPQQSHAYPRPWQQHVRRYATGGDLPCHRRRRRQDLLGFPERDLRLQQSMPAAARHDGMHDHQEPGHQDRYPLHGVSATFKTSPPVYGDGQLVHELDRPVQRAPSSSGTIAKNLQSCASPGFFPTFKPAATSRER